MKKTLLLILCILGVLLSGCRTRTLTEEERQMYEFLHNTGVFCNHWGFENTSERGGGMAFTGIIFDAARLMAGARPSEILRDENRFNSIIYTDVHFVHTQEEAFAITDLPETTLIAWSTERSRQVLAWFNLMAQMPRNEVSHNHVRNRDVEVAETLLEYFPEYGFTWPISMDDVINNPEGMIRLWARVYIPSDQSTILEYARNHEPPTFEEFMRQVEEGQWRWRW